MGMLLKIAQGMLESVEYGESRGAVLSHDLGVT